MNPTSVLCMSKRWPLQTCLTATAELILPYKWVRSAAPHTGALSVVALPLRNALPEKGQEYSHSSTEHVKWNSSEGHFYKGSIKGEKELFMRPIWQWGKGLFILCFYRTFFSLP